MGYQRINETFNRARQAAGLPDVLLKDFRHEVGCVIAESGQPLHVAQRQLGHSSVRTTEEFYAHHGPEFAVSRAREVLDQRAASCGKNGRQTGGESDSVKKPSKKATHSSSNILDFSELREGVGGGDRIRTDE